jgi:hypothetical protein
VSSSKQLSREQAIAVIRALEDLGEKKGVWQSPRSGAQKKYDHLGDRAGMAAPKQLRMIEAMWAEVSRQPDSASRAIALRSFLKRIVGIEEITWLEPVHVRKVINALNAMKFKKLVEVKECVIA